VQNHVEHDLPDFGLATSEDDEKVSDELLHERLEVEHPLVAFSIGEGSEVISLFDWHRRMAAV
jgi:hypothetical protein